jgi:hypothetical protein
MSSNFKDATTNFPRRSVVDDDNISTVPGKSGGVASKDSAVAAADTGDVKAPNFRYVNGSSVFRLYVVGLCVTLNV